MKRDGILIGWYSEGQYRRRVEIDVELRDTDKGLELAISGTSGRALKRDGTFRRDQFGEPFDYCGGQCIEELERVTRFADGWNKDRRDQLVRIWRAWHLNGMRPGCEHQRAEGWADRPIDPSKPTDAYGLHFDGQRSASWNMLAWISPAEHPDGLLGKPCDVCGYRYGSAWLHEPLPDDVVRFARELIDA